ncbi:MAG: cyclodeaminase/cyclohydrolase family protein, partial [Cetobacterium sp.]
MKLVELSVKDFLNIVDSKSPAPGGGSVSALVSA